MDSREIGGGMSQFSMKFKIKVFVKVFEDWQREMGNINESGKGNSEMKYCVRFFLIVIFRISEK